jgi:hypothetical protein
VDKPFRAKLSIHKRWGFHVLVTQGEIFEYACISVRILRGGWRAVARFFSSRFGGYVWMDHWRWIIAHVEILVYTFTRFAVYGTMARNNDPDETSWLGKSVPIASIEGVEENETLSIQPRLEVEVSNDISVHPSERDVSTAIHSQEYTVGAPKAAADILGQPAWVTKFLESQKTSMDSLQTSMDSLNSTMDSMMTSMDSLNSTTENLHAKLKSIASVKSTVKAVGTNSTIRDGSYQNIHAKTKGTASLSNTIKAVFTNVSIRDGNYENIHQSVPDRFMMIVLDDGEQVGQVPTAVTEMNHCFRTKASVLGMTNDQINTFAEAYGEQAVNILAQGLALERANNVLEFLSGA